MTTIVIPKRFCGPPTSGNGGYTCGLVARALESTAEVTLRKPIPLEQAMQIRIQDSYAQLRFGDELIAEGQQAHWTTAAAYHTSFEQSEEAARNSPAFHDHPFPTCFVCGPQRAEGDGLRIFPGELPGNPGEHVYAAPWVPASEFADSSGRIREEFLWAAMDCPTGFAAGFPYEGTLVTGRLAAEVVGHVHAEEKCVLLSWRTAVDGRKHHASAVLTGEDGSVRVHARATWIKLG